MVGVFMRGPRERGSDRLRQLAGAFSGNGGGGGGGSGGIGGFSGGREGELKDVPPTWNGIPVTDAERTALHLLHARRQAEWAARGRGTKATGGGDGGLSPWLHTASGTELLRFLRVQHGNVDDAWRAILAHAQWRTTRHGADTVVRERGFETSPLHREVFWLGLSTQGCPTLVIRTKV